MDRTGPIVNQWSHRNQLQLVRSHSYILPCMRHICLLPRVLNQKGDTCSIHAALNCLETRFRKFLAERGEEFDTSMSIQHAVDALGSKMISPLNVFDWLGSVGVATVQTYYTLEDLDETIPRYGITPGGCHVFSQPANNVEEMVKEMREVGPIIIVIPMCYNYMESILHGIYCADGLPILQTDGFQVTHAVLATGFGITQNNTFYWEYQDSRGRKFGDGGFGRVVSNVVLTAYSIKDIRMIAH